MINKAAPNPKAHPYEKRSASTPATIGPTIAPASENIENTATGVPRDPPVASPTEAAGAVPRKAAAIPYAHKAMINTTRLGANGTTMIEHPASRPPPIMAGRRPTVSTNLPAGARAMVWAMAAQANAIPVQVVLWCSTSTTSTGMSADRTPKEVQPWARLVRQAAWNRGSAATVRKGTVLSSVGPDPLADPGPRQQQQPDRAGDGQGAGVEEEGCPDRHQGQQTADGRSGHAAEQEPALEEAGCPSPHARDHAAEQQAHGRDGEHRRPDPADPAQREQLRVGLRGAGHPAGARPR